MIYGLAYLFMILVITFIWVFLAIIKKPDFINKFTISLNSKLKEFIKLKKEY